MTWPDDLVLGTFVEAEKMLDYAIDAALTRQITLPTRKYVTQGQAVHDCEQVVATMVTVQTGMPGQTTPVGPSVILNCEMTWQLIVEIAIVRCQTAKMSSNGTAPDTSKLLADARQVAADTLILQDVAAERASETFGGVSCTITYPPPSGDFIVTSARYQVAISQ